MRLKKLTFIITLFTFPLIADADFKETKLLCDATINVPNVGVEEGRSDLVVLTEYKPLNKEKAWYISIPLLGEYKVFQDQQRYWAGEAKGNRLEYSIELDRITLDLQVLKLLETVEGDKHLMNYDGKCRLASEPKI